MPLRISYLILFALLALRAQTPLPLDQPTFVTLPAVTAREQTFSFDRGYRVTVPPGASKLIVRFEVLNPGVFSFAFLGVRPRVDITSSDQSIQSITTNNLGNVLIVDFPLDYIREESTYNIGFILTQNPRPTHGVLTASVVFPPASPQVVRVPSTAQVMLALAAPGTTFGPYRLPQNAPTSIPVTAGRPLSFFADGGITYRAVTAFEELTVFIPPAGSSAEHVILNFAPQPFVQGIRGPRASLIGFFSGSLPDGAPPFLNYANGSQFTFVPRWESRSGEVDVTPVRPGLHQPFYIGDGITNEGETRVFVPPAGATRLHLGVLENSTDIPYTGEIRVRVLDGVLSTPRSTAKFAVPSTASVLMTDAATFGTAIVDSGTLNGVLNQPVTAPITVQGGDVLQFRAHGLVLASEPTGSTSGIAFTVPPIVNGNQGTGISGVSAPFNSLMGMFVGDRIDPNLRPPALSFTNRPTEASFSPQLQQVFYVGNGRTPQFENRNYVVPAGARRLILGVHRGGPTLSSLGANGYFKVAVGFAGGNDPRISSVRSGAGFGFGFVPGAIATIFGERFGPLTVAQSSPLPRMLAGVEVYVDEIAAPLYFVSPGQINFQIPFEVRSRSTVYVAVRVNGRISPAIEIAPRNFESQIFTTQDGRPVIVNAVTNTLYSQSTPARRGDTITIYASGLGPIAKDVATGTPAPLDALRPTMLPVQLIFSVGEVESPPVAASFAGLAPGFIGVYQVNATLPSSLPTGEVRLRLAAPGVFSSDRYPFTIAP